jgi:hypothetical protein
MGSLLHFYAPQAARDLVAREGWMITGIARIT